MDTMKILTAANELGLPQDEISELTNYITQYQNASSKSPAEDKDLRNKSPKTATSLADYKKLEADNDRQIKTLGEQIKESKHSIKDKEKAVSRKKKAIFWDPDRKKAKQEKRALKSEKAAISKAKRTLKLNISKQQQLEEQGKKIKYTIKKIKSEAEQAREKLVQAYRSIKTQLETIKTLESMKGLINKKIDLNDPKYLAIIDFYNKNANKKPSLKDPLPLVPVNLRVLLHNELGEIAKQDREAKKQERSEKVAETRKKIDTFVVNTAAKYGIHFTSTSQMLENAKQGATKIFRDIAKAFETPETNTPRPAQPQTIVPRLAGGFDR